MIRGASIVRRLNARRALKRRTIRNDDPDSRNLQSITCLNCQSITCLNLQSITCLKSESMTCLNPRSITCLNFQSITCLNPRSITCLNCQSITCLNFQPSALHLRQVMRIYLSDRGGDSSGGLNDGLLVWTKPDLPGIQKFMQVMIPSDPKIAKKKISHDAILSPRP